MLQHMQVCNYRVYIFVRILSRFYRLLEFEFNKKAEFAPFGGGKSNQENKSSRRRFALREYCFSVIIFFLPKCEGILCIRSLKRSDFRLFLQPC